MITAILIVLIISAFFQAVSLFILAAYVLGIDCDERESESGRANAKTGDRPTATGEPTENQRLQSVKEYNEYMRDLDVLNSFGIESETKK